MAMTPQRAVRMFCVACVGGEFTQVRECGGDKCLNGGCDPKGVCLFYRARMGRGRTSVKTIRKMCLWCMCGSSEQIAQCSDECALHPFRFGTNPNFTDESREKMRQRAEARGFISRRYVASESSNS